MKLLVIGSAGMLGHMVCLYLRQNPAFIVMDITKTNQWSPETKRMDVLNTDELYNFINLHEFDVIINCAALLIQASERNKSMAVRLNAELPHLLEEWTCSQKIRIIQISSDGVFLGDKAPYKIKDVPDGRLFYARTKALGELDNTKDLTIRGSFIGPELNPHGTGLFNWFFHQSGKVKGYQNVVFNGITSLECAKVIEHILLHPLSGCIHVGARSSISKGALLCGMAKQWCYNQACIDYISLPYSDHTLDQIYCEQGYAAPDYPEMLEALRQWMEEHYELYAHYNFK